MPASDFINRHFHVIDESPDWIVVDKPPHLLIHPTAAPGPGNPFTLWDGLRQLLSYEIANGGQISIINRLDRETSGLVLIAKHSAAARLLATAMAARDVEKTYLALVCGHPTWTHTTVDAPLLRQGSVQPSRIHLKQCIHPDGAPALTDFRVLQTYILPNALPVSLLEARPRTGRTHQIRVHAAHLGHPLLGDKIYGPDESLYLQFIATGWTPALAESLVLPRHALHSASLRIPPLHLHWQSPLAPDLANFLTEKSLILNLETSG